jgi:hypothetical protein
MLTLVRADWLITHPNPFNNSAINDIAQLFPGNIVIRLLLKERNINNKSPFFWEMGTYFKIFINGKPGLCCYR